MAVVGFWMLVAGIVGGLVVAPFGYIDWLATPEHTRAKRIGTMHGIGNVAALVLFVLSAVLRINDEALPPGLAVLLSVLAFALLGLTGWLGGELVSRLGVGVSSGVGLDASNSMSEDRDVARQRSK